MNKEYLPIISMNDLYKAGREPQTEQDYINISRFFRSEKKLFLCVNTGMVVSVYDKHPIGFTNKR